MPTLGIGTPVSLKAGVHAGLNNPCTPGCDLFIAVHPGALKVLGVTLTVVVERVGAEVVWVGAW